MARDIKTDNSKANNSKTGSQKTNDSGGKKRWNRIRSAVTAVTILILLCLVAPTVKNTVEDTQEAVSETGSRIEDQIEGLQVSSEGSQSIVDSDPDSIPDYNGEDTIILNDNMPGFTEWDMEHITGEHYADLDELGRCGTAYALLDRSMMPTGERGSISEIRPTGWTHIEYEGLIDSDPPCLYNRSHLIAYALAGEDANEKNLITGTRHMNAETMLPYEEQVMRYLDDSDNHVLYRVSPLFRDGELVARGVEMEAYSVEDDGEDICYHVFVYNVQPGIEIDYETGDSALADE